jgi:hypothetical protein
MYSSRIIAHRPVGSISGGLGKLLPLDHYIVVKRASAGPITTGNFPTASAAKRLPVTSVDSVWQSVQIPLGSWTMRAEAKSALNRAV